MSDDRTFAHPPYMQDKVNKFGDSVPMKRAGQPSVSWMLPGLQMSTVVHGGTGIFFS